MMIRVRSCFSTLPTPLSNYGHPFPGPLLPYPTLNNNNAAVESDWLTGWMDEHNRYLAVVTRKGGESTGWSKRINTIDCISCITRFNMGFVVKEGLSCMLFRTIALLKTRNLALP